MAEVLGRYSNLGPSGERVTKATDAAQRQKRPEPWQAPVLTGITRVRQAVRGREAAILAAYAAGTGCTTLARQYGLSETTMLDWLRRQGAAIRTYGTLAPQATPEMVRLRQDGWSLRQIGEKYGVTRQAVAMRLRRR